MPLWFGLSVKLKNPTFLFFFPKSSYDTWNSCMLSFCVRGAEELVNDVHSPELWTGCAAVCATQKKPLLHFIVANLNADYQTHYLTDSPLTRQFAYRTIESTSVFSCSSFVLRGCAVLGIVLKVELELREEDDVNMPKEKLAVRLPLHCCERYFLTHGINTEPRCCCRTGKNGIHEKI